MGVDIDCGRTHRANRAVGRRDGERSRHVGQYDPFVGRAAGTEAVQNDIDCSAAAVAKGHSTTSTGDADLADKQRSNIAAIDSCSACISDIETANSVDVCQGNSVVAHARVGKNRRGTASRWQRFAKWRDVHAADRDDRRGRSRADQDLIVPQDDTIGVVGIPGINEDRIAIGGIGGSSALSAIEARDAGERVVECSSIRSGRRIIDEPNHFRSGNRDGGRITARGIGDFVRERIGTDKSGARFVDKATITGQGDRAVHAAKPDARGVGRDANIRRVALHFGHGDRATTIIVGAGAKNHAICRTHIDRHISKRRIDIVNRIGSLHADYLDGEHLRWRSIIATVGRAAVVPSVPA